MVLKYLRNKNITKDIIDVPHGALMLSVWLVIVPHYALMLSV